MLPNKSAHPASPSAITKSFASVAQREAEKVLRRLVLVFTLVAVPFVGIYRYASFQQKNTELATAFMSSVSFAIALNDTFQIERAMEGFRRELGAESIALKALSNASMTWSTGQNEGTTLVPFRQDIDLEASDSGIDGQRFRLSLVVPFPVVSILVEVGFLFLLALTTFWFLSKQILSLVNRLSEPIVDLSAELEAGQVSSDGSSSVTEIEVLRARVKEYEVRLSENSKRISDAEIQEEKARIAHQVAHDIRSPLVVFNMINELLPDAPEETRRMLKNAAQRVHDIANDLIQRVTKKSTTLSLPSITTFMLTDLIEGAIAEKRIQISGQREISIQADFSRAYGIFFELASPSNILRAFSNVLNNSIDAFDEEGGNITVSLDSNREAFQVAIADDGCGIPAEVLARLGTERITFGKTASQSGSGIGVLQVKDAVESEGGEMQIESEEGVGTTVRLRFPCAQAPAWFVPSLILTEQTTVVSVDDDPSIHEVWATRIPARHRIFHSLESAAAWAKYLEPSFGDVLFLVDYEFRESKETGLDFILGLPSHVRSILVTSRSSDPVLLKRLQQTSVPMIPKQAAILVPLELQSEQHTPSRPELHA